MEKEISNALAEVNPQLFKSLIHEFRGTLVMLDSDLAAIYGYSTKDFNRQVKNNREKFAEDFMFQLTKEEADVILRCKNFTSSLVEKDSRSGYGGRRYCPYAFTEQGIYMLMTVLRGELATKQSIALIRLFKGMKDFILENQPLLGQREYLQLSLQTTENIRDIVPMLHLVHKAPFEMCGTALKRNVREWVADSRVKPLEAICDNMSYSVNTTLAYPPQNVSPACGALSGIIVYAQHLTCLVLPYAHDDIERFRRAASGTSHLDEHTVNEHYLSR